MDQKIYWSHYPKFSRFADIFKSVFYQIRTSNLKTKNVNHYYFITDYYSLNQMCSFLLKSVKQSMFISVIKLLITVLWLLWLTWSVFETAMRIICWMWLTWFYNTNLDPYFKLLIQHINPLEWILMKNIFANKASAFYVLFRIYRKW